MKKLLLLLVVAFFATGANGQTGKQVREEMKTMESIADTMNFPKPFEFHYIDTVNLTKQQIYNKSLQWMTTVMGDIKPQLQISDSSGGKILVSNVEVIYNVTESITIDVKDGKYRLSFDKYQDVTQPEYPKWVSEWKDSKWYRTSKYRMYLSSQAALKSLRDYLNKKDDF